MKRMRLSHEAVAPGRPFAIVPIFLQVVYIADRSFRESDRSEKVGENASRITWCKVHRRDHYETL